MPTTALITYDAATRLDPFKDANNAPEVVVNLADGTYLKGQVLGEVAATPGTYKACVTTPLAAPASGPTLTTPTGGSKAAGDYNVAYSYVTADGETAPSAVVLTTALLNDHVHVAAVTPLPTGVTSINWYMSIEVGSTQLALALNNDGSAADLAMPVAGAKAPLVTGTARAVDGSGVARGILRHGCTAASGVITIANDQDATQRGVDMFVGGVFKTSELTGLTAAALADLQGILESGTLADGVLRF